MTHILNICPDFLAFWEAAAQQPLNEQQRLWHSMYEAPHRAIFDVYYAGYGHPDGLVAALSRFDGTAAHLHLHLPTITPVIEQVVPPCAALFATSADAIHGVLMVGLFASDAWATRLDGTPTFFLALEVEHNWNLRTVALSAAHEAAHACHQHWSSMATAELTVGHGLFLEGLAILASTIVSPGAPEAAYLWPGGERTITGQPCQAWVVECDQHWPALRMALLHDFARTDRYGSYFYVYPKAGLVAGIPMRAGYVAGYRILARLGQSYSVAEMARWTPARAMSEVQAVLAAG